MLYSSSFQFHDYASIIWQNTQCSDIVTWYVGEYYSGNKVVPNISKMFINLSSCFIFTFIKIIWIYAFAILESTLKNNLGCR